MSLASTLLALGAVALSSAVQGSVGLGLGPLGAPLLLLIDPRLVPGPVLACALVLTVLLTVREWGGLRGRDLAWSVPGRLVGTVAAVAFFKIIPPDRLEPALAVLVLVGVGLAAVGINVPLSRSTLVGAGAASGFIGTVTSIGGPPIALLYQRESGPVVRGTLSAFFLVGIAMSLVALAYTGRFGATEIKLSAVLLPGVFVGYAVSRSAARLLDRGWMRPAILLTSGAACVAVVLKYVVP